MSALLLVEDDPGVAEALRLALVSLGHRVELACDGETGLAKMAAQPFDVMLLDVMMPGIDGFETARRVRVASLLPIIMLTARSDPIDIVAGLECGADDYVTKPVEPRVLDARIKAVLRRATPHEQGSLLAFGELAINPAAMTVTRAGEPVALTPTELRLILELAEHAGQVLSRHQLLHRVWGYGYAGDSRLVDAVVQRHLPLLLRGVPVLDADPPTESRVLLVRDVPDGEDVLVARAQRRVHEDTVVHGQPGAFGQLDTGLCADPHDDQVGLAHVLRTHLPAHAQLDAVRAMKVGEDPCDLRPEHPDERQLRAAVDSDGASRGTRGRRHLQPDPSRPDDGDPAGGGEGCLQPLAVLDRPQIGERNPFDSGGRSYGGCFSAQ